MYTWSIKKDGFGIARLNINSEEFKKLILIITFIVEALHLSYSIISIQTNLNKHARYFVSYSCALLRILW